MQTILSEYFTDRDEIQQAKNRLCLFAKSTVIFKYAIFVLILQSVPKIKHIHPLIHKSMHTHSYQSLKYQISMFFLPMIFAVNSKVTHHSKVSQSGLLIFRTNYFALLRNLIILRRVSRYSNFNYFSEVDSLETMRLLLFVLRNDSFRLLSCL